MEGRRANEGKTFIKIRTNTFSLRASGFSFHFTPSQFRAFRAPLAKDKRRPVREVMRKPDDDDDGDDDGDGDDNDDDAQHEDELDEAYATNAQW